MKNIKAIVIGLACTLPAAAFAGDNTIGTLTMNGNIVEHTCQVPANQLTKTIPFDPVTLADVGKTPENSAIQTKTLQFDITNCPDAAQRVGIRFDFATDSTVNNYIINNVKDNPAEGVEFGFSSDADEIALPTGSVVNAATVTGGAATVNAKASLYRVGSDKPVIGTVQSTATVTINYE